MDSTRSDFFISYTSADVRWGEWIAWQLKNAGYRVTFQAWDFQPGSNFVLEMDNAASESERTIAVLSPAFVESPFASSEWAAAFARDPTGANRVLAPVRVRECNPSGLLGQIVYLDLVGKDEARARADLLSGLDLSGQGPSAAPAFPGAQASPSVVVAPGYPGEDPPIWNVPVGTRIFEGRAQALRALSDGLEQGGAAAVTQARAIHGLGGVGKTQLAARFARENRASYDVVWWIRAEQATVRMRDYAELGARLQLPEAGEPDDRVRVAAVKSWLERSARWLLIFDNAPDPQSIAQLLPEGQGGHVLVTSRRHADWRALGASPVSLSVWARGESLAFLVKRTGDDDADAANSIAEALGDLPLALEQAAAYANSQAISLRAYYALLQDRASDLLARGQPIDYQYTIDTTWNLALTEIDARPHATDLLAMCSYLAPERVPRDVLTRYAGEALQLPDGNHTEDLPEAMQSLIEYALLSNADDTYFDMHRLVQRVVREREDDRQQQAHLVACLRLMLLAFPDHRPTSWPACATLLPHCLSVVAHAENCGVAPIPTAQLLSKMSRYLTARGEFVASRKLIESELVLVEGALGAGHPGMANALSNLGIVLRHLGEFSDAREAHEGALKTVEQAEGPEGAGVAVVLVNLGIVRAQLDELIPAREAMERGLKVTERIYGPSHFDVGRILSNLGIVLDSLDELPSARKALDRALEIIERTYGSEAIEIARPLGSLGNVLSRMGDQQGAREVQERTLAIEVGAYGPDHPEVARTLGNLGIVLAELGEHAGALDAVERALAIEQDVYSPDHPDIAKTRAFLNTLLARGDADDDSGPQ